MTCQPTTFNTISQRLIDVFGSEEASLTYIR